tara:strand:- start:3 stop:1286 length:1284 start_codon:yes stop_codon:yes gene_type:complete
MLNNFYLKLKNFFSSTPSKNSIFSLKDLKKLKEANDLFSIIIQTQAGSEIKFVGGCIRKLINKEEIDDIDFAINITPIELIEILEKNNIKYIKTGFDYGTVTVLINNKKFEITSLRKDIKTDGRHTEVEYTKDWLEDASRRDFTINAIYSDINGNLFDPYGGVEDILNKKVKFIGDPNKRIQEDYLRIVRYLRFFIQYSSKNHDENAIKFIKKNLNGLSKISKERILEELFKMMKLDNFNLLFEDEFCKFILLSALPQLKHYSRLKTLNDISTELKKKIDKFLLLAILIVDETDNFDFFLYKFNISNNDKKRISLIQDGIKKYSIDFLLLKKNLIKICYFENKNFVKDLLLFSIFNFPKKISKIEKLLDYVENVVIPKFPITATFLKEKYKFSESKKLGDALKKLEKKWVDNDFKIDKNNIKYYLNL